jgi:hypothetical protein
VWSNEDLPKADVVMTSFGQGELFSKSTTMGPQTTLCGHPKLGIQSAPNQSLETRVEVGFLRSLRLRRVRVLTPTHSEEPSEDSNPIAPCDAARGAQTAAIVCIKRWGVSVVVTGGNVDRSAVGA